MSGLEQFMSMKEIDAACKQPEAATQKFINNHTMIRIKDPRKSLDFYTRVMGMRLIQMFDQPEAKRALFFVGYADPANIPKDPKDKLRWLFVQSGAIELWYDYGSHTNDTPMHSGNSKPLGYGHMGFAVPDVTAACKRFEELGVEFEMKVGTGIIKDLAYIKDPDGYWIEILNGETLAML